MIKAGFADRLALDWGKSRDQMVVAPAYQGNEGGTYAENLPVGTPCTFLKDGKCELHNLGLKPSECKFAHHSNRNGSSLRMREEMLLPLWDSIDGKAMVHFWRLVVTGALFNNEQKD